MKKLYTFLLITFLGISSVFSQCDEDSKTKVLLVGDSWAFFMGVDGTINDVMKFWGFPEYKFYTNLTLAQNGAKTKHFFQADKQAEIASQIYGNPDIEYVHFSLGGNDVLGNWKSQSFTQQQTDDLIIATKDSLFALIDFIKGIKPTIKIVWGGYAYPNFEEVITNFDVSLGPISVVKPSDHPFYSNWEKMEFPTNSEINALLNIFSDSVANHYANDPRVFFVEATGITQHTYGQPTPLGVAPGGTYAKFTAPLPYGYPDYPSPEKSMRHYAEIAGIEVKDCFHLSKNGFRDIFGYTVQKFYHKDMMKNYFIAENPITNGSVDNGGNTYSELYYGYDGGVDFRPIITFETQGNLEYNVIDASLFLHLKGVTGDNPINNTINVEIYDGSFGTTYNIEASDYNDYSMEMGTPCLHGENSEGYWVRLDLPAELYSYISINNNVQFRLSSVTAATGKVEISGVTDPDFAPVLNLRYGNEPALAVETEKMTTQVLVYPNPAQSVVNISTFDAELIQTNIYTVEGREVMTSIESVIDVQNIPAGTYFFTIVTNQGVVNQTIVIQ